MKVLPFKIPKPIGSTLTVQEDKVQVFYNQLHQHNEIQISHIVKGNGKLIVANSVHRYTSGDIFMIGGNVPHLFQSAPETDVSHMITLFVTSKNFGNGFFGISELDEARQFLEHSKGGIRILSHGKSISKIMHKLPLSIKLHTFRLFLKLVQKINRAQKQELTSFVPSKKISNMEGRRLQLVFEHAMNNFDKQISLKQVSRIVHMTEPAFCRFFKHRTNKTFFDFLIELRIAHACQLLLQPEKMGVAEVSEASGFQSISHFNRKFKKTMSLSPSQYVRKMRGISHT